MLIGKRTRKCKKCGKPYIVREFAMVTHLGVMAWVVLTDKTDTVNIRSGYAVNHC